MAKTIKRKIDHIKLAIEESVESNVDPGFTDIRLIHVSLPEINLNEVDVSTSFLNRRLRAPIIIEPITGGTLLAKGINSNLAEAADDIGVALGVGSQRAALEDGQMIETYSIVRDKAPSVPILANIGCPQLLCEKAEQYAKEAVKMLKADALVIHLNSLQEVVQPEGQTNFKGVIQKIREIVKKLNVPIIAKETGAGISTEVAKRLKSAGVSIIDVSGLGGTSWAAVEYYRALRARNPQKASLGKKFWDWGIPTVASILEVKSISGMKVIASGGVRTGIDIAKSLAIGADLAGMALPFLKPATKDSASVKNTLNNLIEELKTAMFLTGSPNIKLLKKASFVMIGQTKQWIEQRGINIGDVNEKDL